MLMIDSILKKYKNSFKLGARIIISTCELISKNKEKIFRNKLKMIIESSDFKEEEFKIL